MTKLEKGKRVNMCLERYGEIKMYIVEDIKDHHVRLKEITLEDIDSGKITLKDIDSCHD